MNKLLVIIILVLVLGGGYYVFSQGGSIEAPEKTEEHMETTETHMHGHEANGEHAHSHSHSVTYEVTDSSLVPMVDFSLEQDPAGGWNVQITTENFEFTPENVNKENVLGEGHAHIYIDGEKIARVYGSWYHIANVEPGDREVRVTLNANNHAEYSFEGEIIQATKIVTIE